MSYNKIQELSNKFATQVLLNQADDASRVQKEHIQKFPQQLQRLLGEMEGEIVTLKGRGYPAKRLEVYVRAYNDLRNMISSSDRDNPYKLATEFAQYVLDGTTGHMMRYLVSTVQHHLGTGHPSPLPAIKQLALQVKSLGEKSDVFQKDEYPFPLKPTGREISKEPTVEEISTNPAVPNARAK
jgi:hypothetical protein